MCGAAERKAGENRLKPKFVFFDIDGTLFDEQKSIPASAAAAISRLQQNGIQVGIATGRAPFMFAPLRKQLKIDVYISFNGQYVVDREQVVYKNVISLDELKGLEKYSQKQGHAMVFMNHQRMSANAEEHPFVNECIGGLKVGLPAYDPRYYHDHEIYQALIFCHKESESSYRSAFPQLQFIRWHEKSMDVLPTRGSKAMGIQMVLDRWGASMEEVCVFGDANNDIEMLNEAGTGIAMGNAPEHVKHAADWVTKPVQEHGIEYGLKKLGLI